MVTLSSATSMANIVIGIASLPLPSLPSTNSNSYTLNHKIKTQKHNLYLNFSETNNTTTLFPSTLSSSSSSLRNKSSCSVLACLPSSSSSPSTKLYVSG